MDSVTGEDTAEVVQLELSTPASQQDCLGYNLPAGNSCMTCHTVDCIGRALVVAGVRNILNTHVSKQTKPVLSSTTQLLSRQQYCAQPVTHVHPTHQPHTCCSVL